jgi:RNA polymerase sigma-70 factor, ECF subfamily
MSQDEDVDDVKRVLAGDTEAFGRIVRRHQRVLFAFGRRFFLNRADVEDFVQEVFLQAYRRIATFRGDGLLRSWLLGIAYHHAVRTNGPRPDLASVDEQTIRDSNESPERQLLRREACRSIGRAIRELPERFATCLDLYFSFGMTYEEISATTGHPVNTVRSHIRRAKEQLRATLSDDMLEGCYDVS